MTIYDAIQIARGTDSHPQYLQAWQLLLDTGMPWALTNKYLQPFFQDRANKLIDAGYITSHRRTKQ